VPFYGIPSGDYDVTKIRGPVLGHFARHDGWCTPARVDALEQALDASAVPHQLFRYDAQHAFFNDTRVRVYSPENAKVAWERTVSFLQGALH
jgi:carboxymethylenebutenolidase